MRLNRWWTLGDAATIRWDILHVTFSPSGNVIAEGGKASASAQNKSTITLTGGDYGIEGVRRLLEPRGADPWGGRQPYTFPCGFGG